MQVRGALQMVCKVTGRVFHPTEGSDGRVYCSECHQVVYEDGTDSEGRVVPRTEETDLVHTK